MRKIPFVGSQKIANWHDSSFCWWHLLLRYTCLFSLFPFLPLFWWAGHCQRVFVTPVKARTLQCLLFLTSKWGAEGEAFHEFPCKNFGLLRWIITYSSWKLWHLPVLSDWSGFSLWTHLRYSNFQLGLKQDIVEKE